MKHLHKLTLALLLVLACTASAGEFKCPIDGSGGYFTGQTRTAENGKLMREYKCTAYGHLTWVIAGY